MIKKNIPIVCGGFGAASLQEEEMKGLYGIIDYFCIGEGEELIVQLYNFIKYKKGLIKNIPNLIYFDKENLIKNRYQRMNELDKLPFPNRNILKKFNVYRNKLISISATRGCPYHCSFCSVHTIWKNQWRCRSIPSIIQEIHSIDDTFHPKIINFEDDNLSYDKEWFGFLLDELIRINFDNRIEFTAMNGMNYHQLDENIIKHMKRAGFKSINLSISSLNEKDLTCWERPSGKNSFFKIIKLLREYSFKITVYFIIGAPGQNWKNNADTIIQLSEQSVYLGGSIYYLTPNQKLAQDYLVSFPKERIYYRSTSFYSIAGDFSPLDKITLLRLTRLINYIKSEEKLSQLDIQWINKIMKTNMFWGKRNNRLDFEIPTNKEILKYYFQQIKNHPVRTINDKKIYL